MDAGRRDDEDRLGAAATALSAHHFEPPDGQNHNHHHHPPHHHRSDNNSISSNGPVDFAYHNGHDLASFASDNFAAFAANSSANLTPDNYYGSGHHFDDTTDFADSDNDDPMASVLSVPRQPAGPPPRASRHSGASSKSGAPSSANRQPTKINFRSVSAPVDEKALATSRARAAAASVGGHKPSVKDLKRRFDKETSKAAPAATHKSAPRSSSKGPTTPSSHRGLGSSPVASRDTSYTALRSSASNRDYAEHSSTTRSTQRPRAVAEDHVSSNPQSFASRVHKPRVSREGSSSLPTATKPPSRPASPGRLSSPKQTRGLLFGEVLPGHTDIGNAGYGIEGVQQTGFHESSGQNSKLHSRSLSQSEVEPPSPSDWYRDTAATPDHQKNGNPDIPKASKKHTRAFSDDPYKKTSVSQSRPSQSSRPPLSSSRLPVAVKNNISASSSSASPSSSRANSPAFARRQAQSQGKTSGTVSGSSSKGTITHGTTSRRGNSSSTSAPSSSSNRLNAYIAAPPQRLSPQLRSSRPRQPVSSASTASSRLKAAEAHRAKSPTKAESRTNTKSSESGTRRRKILLGPIDFESRREQIKLSYSKSIKETEARAIARRLAEDKKQEKLLAVAEAERAAKQEQLRLEEQEQCPDGQHFMQLKAVPDVEAGPPRTPELVEHKESHETEQPVLAITTDLRQDDPLDLTIPPQSKLGNSPELCLPGSFPSLVSLPNDGDEAPPSAVSDTTEFDNEPQTDPPVQSPPARSDVNTSADTERASALPHFESHYRSPFDSDSPNSEGMSIKITLEDVLDPSCSSVAPTPTDTEFDLDQNARDSCDEDDDEYVPRPLVLGPSQTTVTIIGRNTDFSPPGSASGSQHLASPGLHSHQTGLGLRNLDANTPMLMSSPDPYHNDDQSAGLNKLEGYFIGPQILGGAGDQIQSHRSGISLVPAQHDASHNDGASSDFGAGRESFLEHSDLANRISQSSIWTDYSVRSQKTQSAAPDKQGHPELQFTISQRGPSRASTSAASARSAPFGMASRDIASSVDASPRDLSQGFTSDREVLLHLPSVNTGASFTVRYDDTKIVVNGSHGRPEHQPPHPPFDLSSLREGTMSAPPSEYYNDTRPSSYAQGPKDYQSEFSLDRQRPSSEVFTTSESAARSTDQMSVATSEGPPTGTTQLDNRGSLPKEITNSAEADALPPKEKKRLFTRLQTIKELVDTEAYFIRDMNIVEEIYKGTAEACPQLDDNTIKLIFRNTDEIIAFHSKFSAELKEGVASIYVPKSHRNKNKGSPPIPDGTTQPGTSTAATAELCDEKDRLTVLGPIFSRNMEAMQAVHETFLKNSDHAAKRLIQIQDDPTVKVWLNECNEVAKDLTKAWNLDSLLIKPMQRITKYPNLLIQLLGETPADHPDRPALLAAKEQLETAIEDINKTKKNFELVGQIVGRKRKDSDVRAGFARAFGKRVDKLQPASSRPEEDTDYNKLHEKFGDDYLRLQVVLRDVEYYTRQVSEYVHVFLQFLSSMELVMRLQPSPHPEIESKWVRFNVSMRDIEKVALAQHLSQVRKHVIEPFEHVIKAYGNPSLAMKKRSKRRLDFEKSIQLKKNSKKIDKQTADGAEQYEALNETLKKELPKLSALTEKVGNICLGNLINIQTQWYSLWKDKVKMVLEDAATPELADIVTTFSRDYKFQEEQISAIGIVNPASKGRPSQSTSIDDSVYRLRPRPADLSPRGRGLSINSDTVPSLPTPDFMKRNSGQFAVSPTVATLPSPSHQYYRDYYAGASATRPTIQASAMVSEGSQSGRSMTAPARPSTGHSQDSSMAARQSIDSSSQVRSSTTSMQPSPLPYLTSDHQRFSGLFQSALPPSERQDRATPSRPSRASSRASSREREPINGYNVLWLAASLFEFNIETTKTEAGYPYLTYQAGEIFDVIAEKGELWLAKNQDDPSNLVGWLWSKHFAKLADD
ncbi:dynamin-binding protein [Microdochium nivale]|nr:dynamin-binding protein [Microdochium nivale]